MISMKLQLILRSYSPSPAHTQILEPFPPFLFFLFYLNAPHCAIINLNAPHCAFFSNAPHCAIFFKCTTLCYLLKCTTLCCLLKCTTVCYLLFECTKLCYQKPKCTTLCHLLISSVLLFVSFFPLFLFTASTSLWASIKRLPFQAKVTSRDSPSNARLRQ